MEVEEFKALEAALAFFDDCDNGVTEFASSSDESVNDVTSWPVETAANEARKVRCHGTSKNIVRPSQLSADVLEIDRIKAKLAVPGRNRSRDFQKLELLQLRVEATALQEQVEELQRTKGEPMDINRSLVRGAGDAGLTAWQCLAKRQKKLRKEAESDNLHLRGIVKSQMKTIQTIKRLFNKQIIAETRPSLSRRFNVKIVPNSRDEYAVLEQLSISLSNLFEETDRVLLPNGLSAVTSPFLRINTQSIAAASTRIELLKYDVLPFDYRTVAEAFMGKMASNYEGAEDKRIPSFLRKKVIARATTLELEERVKIQYRFTGIKYSEPKREVIVQCGQNKLLEAFGVAVDGIEYQEKCWAVL